MDCTIIIKLSSLIMLQSVITYNHLRFKFNCSQCPLDVVNIVKSFLSRVTCVSRR